MSYNSNTIQAAWGKVCWVFLHHGRIDSPSLAAFVIDESMHDSPRHFAGCRLDGHEVRVASCLASLPNDVILGVLAHEAGHVEDFRSPDLYGLSGGKLHVYKASQRHRRSSHETEVVADKIAALGMGERVGYVKLDGIGWIQCLGSGVARPKTLK